MKITSLFSTQIIIGKSILDKLIEYCKKSSYYEFIIVTDSNVLQLHANHLKELFQKEDILCHLISFPHGEENKTRETKAILEDKLLQKQVGRKSCIIALGGGVVTDISGFLASTYLRGIDYINVPTTLMGMVDASIGGKTGVNTALGKNLIGSFHHPKAIFMDLDFLKTCSYKILKDGMIEVIKHALIYDASFFSYISQNMKKIISDNYLLEEVLYKNVLIKKTIVEKDEKERGIRQVLNFGHTIGHALEKLSEYKINHADAVMIGMLVENYISFQSKILLEEDMEKIFLFFLNHYDFKKFSFSFSFENFLTVLSMDKKAKKKSPHFILLEKIGQTYKHLKNYSHPVSIEILPKAYDWILENFEVNKKCLPV